jgi:DNA-binding transcriptional ArsR family regulator
MHAQLVDIDDPRLVKALAHPIRMKILNILDERTATPKELAEALGLPLENVSYHVRTLKDFGFIKLERTRQVRGAVEHHYKLAARPRVGSKLWAEVPRVVQEALTDATLNVIVETIGQAASEGKLDVEDAVVARHSVMLDEEAYKEAFQVMVDAAARIEALSEESQTRANDDERKRVSAAFFLFETPQALPAEDATKSRDAAARRRVQKSRA